MQCYIFMGVSLTVEMSGHIKIVPRKIGPETYYVRHTE